MADEIKLTAQELEELKNDIQFREKTTLTLKHLCKKFDRFNGIIEKVEVLKTQAKIQWWLISVIIVGILSIAFRVILMK